MGKTGGWWFFRAMRSQVSLRCRLSPAIPATVMISLPPLRSGFVTHVVSESAKCLCPSPPAVGHHVSCSSVSRYERNAPRELPLSEAYVG